MTEGRLVSGFEGQHCASDACRIALTTATGAYLHKDREDGRLVLFCEACSEHVNLHASLRFPRIAL